MREWGQRFVNIYWMSCGVREEEYLKRGFGTWMGENSIIGQGYCVGVVNILCE